MVSNAGKLRSPTREGVCSVTAILEHGKRIHCDVLVRLWGVLGAAGGVFGVSSGVSGGSNVAKSKLLELELF